MAVAGSKSVGAASDDDGEADGEAEKLSCGSCGEGEAVDVDFLPVNMSQLQGISISMHVRRPTHR